MLGTLKSFAGGLIFNREPTALAKRPTCPSRFLHLQKVPPRGTFGVGEGTLSSGCADDFAIG
jgi:hypothetical protein